MRERDLERASQILTQIKEVEKCMVDHEKFGRHLRLFFELPVQTKVIGEQPSEWVDVATGLALNQDELHARSNILIHTMLSEAMMAHKAQLRKLGIRLEEDESQPKKKKEPLRLVDKSGGKS